MEKVIMMIRYALLSLVVFIPACASSNGSAPPASASPRALAAVPESGLGAQTLAPGECGLFLWSRTNIDQFIFFSRALSGRAALRYGPDTLSLRQSQARGEIFGQFNTETVYGVDGGGTVVLSFEAGDALTGGQRIENGLLTRTDAGGWQTKLPVAGVRACQPE